MLAHETESRHSFAAWESAVVAAEPAVLFVEPRILRRVIKQDRRLTGIGFQVPHAHVYTIERERLLIIAERPELDLSPAAELPRNVILLPRAEMDESVASLTTDEALHWYWRQLFHARVHIALEEQLASRRLEETEIERRVRALGAGTFAEIRNVLVKDDLLPPVHTVATAYVEFAAVALELEWFAPAERQYVFPSVDDWDAVDALLSDVPDETLYHRTRPAGAPEHLRKSADLRLSDHEIPVLREARGAQTATSSARSLRLAWQADRAARMGNHVRAAILRMRGARYSFPERAREYRVGALRELEHLAARIADLLQLSREETLEWVAALGPLLEPASAGFRRVEARLLYDLQTACVSNERGLYHMSLWGWIWSGGKRALRRPLPLLQRVQVAKALRSATNRVPTVRLEAADRDRLEALLQGASERVDVQFRDSIRPEITDVLDRVGLVPQNVPERVSRRKLVEELLDRVVERGFINLGDLRDSLSQSDLKLADLSGVSELVLGDPLLRADRELAGRLEGVYRAGTVYLRMPQRLSSLAFGTRPGRWLTQYIILPFGGAYLGLEAIRHVVHWFTPAAARPSPSGFVGPMPHGLPPPETFSHGPDWRFFLWVACVGVLLLAVLHRPRFRAVLTRVLTRLWKTARHVVVDLPAELLRAPWVQRVLQSQTWGVVRNYALRPAVATLLVYAALTVLRFNVTRNLVIQVFLAADLFLNSPIGRYAEEWLTDLLVRAWHELRIRVLAALFNWVMDVFHQLIQWVERIIYAVDEWLRFRAGDPRSFVAVKVMLGAIWSVFAYVIRFCVTLLIEPQVNPIKHFPVVTVSHKILLPYTLTLSRLLLPLIGPIWAPTLATTVILLLPGVFGFLVWELKGNWRLYRANRPQSLVPMPVGSHGETIVALVRPGIHSGTLPKLFARLRHALADVRHTEHGRAARKQLAALQGVEVAVRRFVGRTLCELLREVGFQECESPQVGRVRLATNRIDVEILLGGAKGQRGKGAEGDDMGSVVERMTPLPGPPPAEARGEGERSDGVLLRFEDLSGWLTARMTRAGWARELDGSQRALFNAAVAGLYKRAGVDLVFEQMDVVLHNGFEIRELTPDGIIVVDREGVGLVASYDLRSTSRRLMAESSTADDVPWPTLDREEFLFGDSPLDWETWVSTWDAAAQGSVAPELERYPRVVSDGGASDERSRGMPGEAWGRTA